MSVIIGNTDITRYISQGGISESLQRVVSGNSESIGAHYSYNIKALMPTNIKNTMAACSRGESVSCTVDDVSMSGEISSFTASVAVEHGESIYWNVDITVTDKSLSSG